MKAAEWIPLAVALLASGTLGAVFQVIAQRRKVGADATSAVSAAARELIDPLRKELATERAEHAEELEMERRKVKEVRDELSQAMAEAKALRKELAQARREMDALRSENAGHRRYIRELEMQLARRG